MWKSSDFNWKVELPAGGHSSPVLWGDKIFLTCADDAKSAERQVVCLHADNGRILWTKKYSSTFHTKHVLNSFASATAAVDEERVYLSWSTPQEYTLLALDHAGQEVWQKKLGPFVSQHSCGTSPVVFEDFVILEPDHVLDVLQVSKGCHACLPLTTRRACHDLHTGSSGDVRRGSEVVGCVGIVVLVVDAGH